MATEYRGLTRQYEQALDQLRALLSRRTLGSDERAILRAEAIGRAVARVHELDRKLLKIELE